MTTWKQMFGKETAKKDEKKEQQRTKSEGCIRCRFFTGEGCCFGNPTFPDWANTAVKPIDCPVVD